MFVGFLSFSFRFSFIFSRQCRYYRGYQAHNRYTGPSSPRAFRAASRDAMRSSNKNMFDTRYSCRRRRRRSGTLCANISLTLAVVYFRFFLCFLFFSVKYKNIITVPIQRCAVTTKPVRLCAFLYKTKFGFKTSAKNKQKILPLKFLTITVQRKKNTKIFIRLCGFGQS